MKYLRRFASIDDRMLWKENALKQLNRFHTLAAALNVPIAAVGEHTSKSIRLPVVSLHFGSVEFLLRDNFYDVNLCVLSPNPVALSLEEMFEDILPICNWDWYLEQVEKARGYSWKEWADEQMDDFGTLRVRTYNSKGQPLDWTKEPKEKDRWRKRMTDPSWYKHDWSSATITWEGEFGPEAKLFVQQYPFAEGISGVVHQSALQPYQPGRKEFTLALNNMEQAETIIKRVGKNNEV